MAVEQFFKVIHLVRLDVGFGDWLELSSRYSIQETGQDGQIKGIPRVGNKSLEIGFADTANRVEVRYKPYE